MAGERVRNEIVTSVPVLCGWVDIQSDQFHDQDFKTQSKEFLIHLVLRTH